MQPLSGIIGEVGDLGRSAEPRICSLLLSDVPAIIHLKGWRMTPNELADELGISPLQLRRFLRKRFPRTPAEKYDRWYLTVQQIDAARKHFGGKYGLPRTTV